MIPKGFGKYGKYDKYGKYGKYDILCCFYIITLNE